MAINDITFGESVFVRVGTTGLIQRSEDGELWTAQASGTTNHLWGVIHNPDDSVFVAVGESGTILRSDDAGFTWNTAFVDTSRDIFAIDYADGIFLAVGETGLLLISLDTGEGWGGFDTELEVEENLRSVSIGTGYITVTGDDGYVATWPLFVGDLSPEIEENVSMGEQPTSTGSFNHSASDEIGLREWTYDPLTSVDYEDVIAEQVLVLQSQDVSFGAAITRTEGLALLDRPFINNETLAEAVSLNEILSAALGFSVLEDILMDDAVLATMSFRDAVSELVEATDSVTGSVAAAIAVTDGLDLSDVPSAAAGFAKTVQELVAVRIGMQFDGEEYTGLVVNTKSFALTRYSGYNFNSFAKVRGQYFGAAADGIYYLEGDDDNGTDIEAKIRTAMLDFGADHQKRVPRAYLGIRGDGEVYFKTILNEDEEHWYRVQNVRSSFHNSRVKLGRGTTSSAWQFELSNEEDGSFFELSDITLIPVILTKRAKC